MEAQGTLNSPNNLAKEEQSWKFHILISKHYKATVIKTMGCQPKD